MQLTKHTDYAYKSLIYMASMSAETITINEIAKRFQIPKSHLMKVISALVSKGYVRSIRGKQGGVALSKPADEINLRDIVVAMETTLEPIDCVGQECLILGSCKLKFILSEARDSYLDSLEKYTLADIVDEPTTYLIHHVDTLSVPVYTVPN